MTTPRSTLALLALAGVALLPARLLAAEARPPLHRTAAEACAQCHPQTYRQWQSSLHARSSPLRDPIHGAFYRKVVGDPRVAGQTLGGRYPVCLQCHVPAAAIDGETRVDADPAYQEGVTCVSCHALTRFNGVTAPDGTLRLGMQAYDRSTTDLQGPTGGSGAIEEHPFPVAANGPLFTGNGACMGCHERRNNARGVPLCRTGDEYATAGAGATCQSCHMPKVHGITDHSMLGGHSAAMVRQGVTLTVIAHEEADGVAANVSLRNRLPHGFPTGAPFRSAYLEVVAMDASGHEVWRNYRTSPTEDPQAILATRLVDDAGHPAPPPKATRIAADTRLKPAEVRQLAYQIPAAGVTAVRARLLYRLLPPGLEHQLAAVLSDDLKGPKVAAEATTTVE
jgi:hypothetical protein